jgi:hypothetical protein
MLLEKIEGIWSEKTIKMRTREKRVYVSFWGELKWRGNL